MKINASQDILNLYPQETQYDAAIHGTIFESSEHKQSRTMSLNEALGTSDYQQSPYSYCHFNFPFGKLLGGILGLITAALAGIGMIISRAIALRKLKNMMIKIKYWVEYGYHKKQKKGSPMGLLTFNGRWFKSEADKDFPSYTSMFCSNERELTTQTEVLLKALGLRDDSNVKIENS